MFLFAVYLDVCLFFSFHTLGYDRKKDQETQKKKKREKGSGVGGVGQVGVLGERGAQRMEKLAQEVGDAGLEIA